MLTDDQVVAVRNARQDGTKIKYLAALYGVAPQTISAIVTGQRRRDAGGPISVATSPHTGTKMTKPLITRAHRMRDIGQSLDVIAKKIGVSKATISKALAK